MQIMFKFHPEISQIDKNSGVRLTQLKSKPDKLWLIPQNATARKNKVEEKPPTISPKINRRKFG